MARKKTDKSMTPGEAEEGGPLFGLDENAEIADEDVVILVDEDKNEYRFVQLAQLEVEGETYAVLAPEEQIRDPELEEVELSFFRVATAGELERYMPIEDEATFEAVRKACAELLGMDEDAEEGGGDYN